MGQLWSVSREQGAKVDQHLAGVGRRWPTLATCWPNLANGARKVTPKCSSEHFSHNVRVCLERLFFVDARPRRRTRRSGAARPDVRSALLLHAEPVCNVGGPARRRVNFEYVRGVCTRTGAAESDLFLVSRNVGVCKPVDMFGASDLRHGATGEPAEAWPRSYRTFPGCTARSLEDG